METEVWGWFALPSGRMMDRLNRSYRLQVVCPGGALSQDNTPKARAYAVLPWDVETFDRGEHSLTPLVLDSTYCTSRKRSGTALSVMM